MKTQATDFPDYYSEGMPGYVLRDWEVVDYECYELKGTDLWFRGPAPSRLEENRYFTAIGAAQTFGCFCLRPYPAILADLLGIEALNLGYSGAGPSFFLQRPDVLSYINRGAFCVVQVMSARSTSNSLLENNQGLAYGKRRSDGAIMTAEAVFDEFLASQLARIPILNERFKRALLRKSRLPLPSVRKVINESRQHWIGDYHALMQAITVPKVLLWFSTRKPSYIPRYDSQSGIFGSFPQLVNASMVHQVATASNYYAECITRRGLPQPLLNRFTGEPTTVDLRRDRKQGALDLGEKKPLYSGTWKQNTYYPTPEMHEDAAAALETICKRWTRKN